MPEQAKSRLKAKRDRQIQLKRRRTPVRSRTSGIETLYPNPGPDHSPLLEHLGRAAGSAIGAASGYLGGGPVRPGVADPQVIQPNLLGHLGLDNGTDPFGTPVPGTAPGIAESQGAVPIQQVPDWNKAHQRDLLRRYRSGRIPQHLVESVEKHFGINQQRPYEEEPPVADTLQPGFGGVSHFPGTLQQRAAGLGHTRSIEADTPELGQAWQPRHGYRGTLRTDLSDVTYPPLHPPAAMPPGGLGTAPPTAIPQPQPGPAAMPVGDEDPSMPWMNDQDRRNKAMFEMGLRRSRERVAALQGQGQGIEGQHADAIAAGEPYGGPVSGVPRTAGMTPDELAANAIRRNYAQQRTVHGLQGGIDSNRLGQIRRFKEGGGKVGPQPRPIQYLDDDADTNRRREFLMGVGKAEEYPEFRDQHKFGKHKTGPTDAELKKGTDKKENILKPRPGTALTRIDEDGNVVESRLGKTRVRPGISTKGPLLQGKLLEEHERRDLLKRKVDKLRARREDPQTMGARKGRLMRQGYFFSQSGNKVGAARVREELDDIRKEEQRIANTKRLGEPGATEGGEMTSGRDLTIEGQQIVGGRARDMENPTSSTYNSTAIGWMQDGYSTEEIDAGEYLGQNPDKVFTHLWKDIESGELEESEARKIMNYVGLLYGDPKWSSLIDDATADHLWTRVARTALNTPAGSSLVEAIEHQIKLWKKAAHNEFSQT